MQMKNVNKAIGVLSIMIALAAAAGCGGGGSSAVSSYITGGGAATTYNLTFTGNGYDVHNGQTFKVAVVRTSDSVVVNSGSATVAAGAFSFTFNGALAASTAYRLDYYADVNASSSCDAPPTDHVWSTAIAAPTTDVTINDAHDATFDATACATLNGNGYDLTFTGTGYDVHNGQTLHIVLTDTTNSTIVFHVTGSVASGAFSFSWPGILTAGRTYNLDYFADVNGNGVCDGPSAGEDHAWRSAIAAVGNDVTVATTHTAIFTNVCASFP